MIVTKYVQMTILADSNSKKIMPICKNRLSLQKLPKIPHPECFRYSFPENEWNTISIFSSIQYGFWNIIMVVRVTPIRRCSYDVVILNMNEKISAFQL